MVWQRLWSVLPALWPAVAVWLGMTMPSLAWGGQQIRDNSWLQPTPWVLRPLLWIAQHVWPYSKLWRLRARWDRYEAQVKELVARQHLDSEMSLLTGVRRMPARLELGLPPRSQAEADSWLAAQEARGATPLA